MSQAQPSTVSPQQYYKLNSDGTAQLGRVGPIGLEDCRLVAYEECESVNAAVGLALSLAGGLSAQIVAMLSSIQHDLYDLVSDLGTPTADTERGIQMTEGHIVRLQRANEHYGKDIEPPEGFALPGGTAPAALLSQARVATLRAERACRVASHTYPDTFGQVPARYLAELSYLLTALARAANAEHGDTIWRPQSSVAEG